MAVIKQVLFVLFLLLLFPTVILAQDKKVDAQFLYNYYEQDGENSPVTGGIGTEELQFHGPSLIVNIVLDSAKTLHLNGGVDIYSSASTDKIDFNVSSASAKDARSHISVGMSHYNKKKKTNLNYHGSFSIESDYTSFGLGGSYSKSSKNQNNVYTLAAQIYIDDCRWGRLSNEDQLTLIYPQELRYKEWEEKYIRQTYSLNFSWARILTKRVNASLFVNPTFQSGLLATTFHRIYFQDPSDVRVEKLPYNRFKLPIGIRANYFVGKRWILRGYYRFYADNWNIRAHSIEIETPFKITPFSSIFPFYRIHAQTSSKYFKPYGTHLSNQTYYTSDYDLSAFNSQKFGIGISLYPAKGLWLFNSKKSGLLSAEIRSGLFRRSNGLHAFYLATAFNFGRI